MNTSSLATPKSAASSTNTSSKTNKPFCSIAYLAKSSFAINSDGIRIVKGPTESSLGSTNQPENTHNSLSSSCNDPDTSSHCSNSSSGASSSDNNSSTSSIVDVFGEINEEQLTNPNSDEVDSGVGCQNSLDPRRPWELANAYVKRIPPALMTATQLNQQHQHAGSGMPSLNKLNSMDCWDYTIELECLKGPQDLQLAAELGKTLLERNKELETLLKEHKATIDEQEQEIVYLKKHTTALREVNDSRLKVYEQLEVGIQDLERANHRLSVENASDKKYIKTLTHNIETLESRCDELNKQLDETRQTLSMERRKNERLLEERAGQGTDATAQRLKPTDAQEHKSPSAERSAEAGYNANTTAPENCNFAFQTPPRYNANSTGLSDSGSGAELFDLSMTGNGADNEEVLKLLNELETKKRELITEKQRITELEEQLGAIIQENQTLQKRFAQNSAAEEMRSMHDELSILDEVRQGQMCSRCLGAMDDRATINDEASSLAPTEECDEDDDDERSHLGLDQQLQRDLDNCSENSQAAYRSNISSIKMKPNSLDLHGNDGTASPNPYRDLVDKYEALLELQRSSIGRKNGMSLAEEFQSSGDFNQTQKQMYQAVADANCGSSQNGDAASSCNGSQTNDAMSNANSERKDKNGRGAGRNARTPTEFSEAETSSSGYSDETSNKYTQTEERPGYFLCSIGDGEDCKFSIYDDASPIDSRFRNRPEYRELFKEIFSVLKKAAENKEEGEKLPLLDDANPASAAAAVPSAKVPPVTPANEELPVDFGDDAQSIISSAISEQSFAMSECVTKLERKVAKKHIIEKNQENKPPSMMQLGATSTTTAPNGKQIMENGRVLTPLKREPLEYVSVNVGIKKKNRRKNRNFSTERAESPAALPSPPRFFVASGKKRKDMRPFVPSPMASTPEPQTRTARLTGGSRCEWTGNSMIIYNRGMQTPPHLRGRELDLNASLEYRPSLVSQELHKLKKLDLSYAEVLRKADACKHHHQQQHQQHRRRQNHQNYHQQH